MDYEALKAAVAQFPADMSDVDVAIALAAETVPIKVDVSISDVESYLRLHGLVFSLRLWKDKALQQGTINEAVSAAAELVDMIASPRLSKFETSNPARLAALQAMLDGLVQARAGGFAQENMDELLSLTDATAPKWPGVTAHDVWVVRGQPK